MEWDFTTIRWLLVSPKTISPLEYLAVLVIAVVCWCYRWIGLLIDFLCWQLACLLPIFNDFLRYKQRATKAISMIYVKTVHCNSPLKTHICIWLDRLSPDCLFLRAFINVFNKITTCFKRTMPDIFSASKPGIPGGPESRSLKQLEELLRQLRVTACSCVFVLSPLTM